MSARTTTLTLLSCACLAAVAVQADARPKHFHPKPAPKPAAIELSLTGAVELGAGVAEISAFDPRSKRLYIVDGSAILKIVDLRNPAAPVELPAEAIDVSADILADTGVATADANSVAVKNGLLAVAITADPKTDDGFVAFYGTDGTYRFACRAGALPDMLTFTPDGRKILVANEGEPGDVDPAGSVSIIDVRTVLRKGHCDSLHAVRTAGFERFDGHEDKLRARGVRIFPDRTFSLDAEPEYIAVSPDSNFAWVTLQEANAMALVHVGAAKVLKILPLGLKDHSRPGNGLDASDEDGPGGDPAINIANWPVFGTYMPDAVSAFTVGGSSHKLRKRGGRHVWHRGHTFLVTANEGDDRGETARVKDIDLDPAAFPDAADLQEDAALGRYTISTIDGDTDGDGDYDRLHGYGARSFTIWNGFGRKVYDSGDLLERKTAELAPDLFNADNGDPDDFDTRSDNKGPEPEGATTGEVKGRPYAFIGLERGPGGVMVFDVSKPWAPRFIQYVRRDEDVSPEGLLFISEKDSPTRKPLLVLSHEISGTVAVYEIKAKGGWHGH